MIKILFFFFFLSNNGSSGGAEKVLITLVNHMDPSKFDITVQTLFPDEYASLLNSNIRYKYCYPKKTSLYYNIFRVEAQLGWVYPLHIKDDYDIEVAYLESETTKVMAASTNKNAKKIAWVHCDFDIAIKDKEAFVLRTEKQYRKFDRIACVSEKCKESFVDLFGENPTSVVIQNVINADEIIEKAGQQLLAGITKRKITLCIVGRFSPQKNYFRLLTTANRLHKEGYDFDLWILGDGQQREQIETFIKDNSMSEYVFLFGFQKNPYPFMKVADVLVCSSDYEGFSTFVTEGLILGKPIVTTDCSGMRELLGNNEFGIVTENSDEGFYLGVKSFLSDQKLSRYYSAKAQERGLDFHTQKLVQDTEKFFFELQNER